MNSNGVAYVGGLLTNGNVIEVDGPLPLGDVVVSVAGPIHDGAPSTDAVSNTQEA